MSDIRNLIRENRDGSITVGPDWSRPGELRLVRFEIVVPVKYEEALARELKRIESLAGRHAEVFDSGPYLP